MVNYSNGKAHQCLGSIYMGGMEGPFPDAIEFLKKEFNQYTDDYVKKAGIVYGAQIYANSVPHQVSLSHNDQRSFKFDRIYLRLSTVYDYDDPNGKRELQIWGERPITPDEQEALGAKIATSKKEQERREREMLATLKAKFGEK